MNISWDHSRRYVFLLILLTIFGCERQKELLPAEFHGHTLSQKLTGEEARQHVNQLHLQSVTDTENEIGFYAGDLDPTIIYVTHYSDSESARDDFRKMTEKISPQNSVFIAGEHLDVRGEPVYRCFGMGQTHFVFAHQNHLFWVSVNTMIGMEFLSNYLDYLKS